MEIVYSSSDRYAGIFAMSVTSLFETNRESKLTVYLIDSGISEENRQRIFRIAEKYRRQIMLIPMPPIETLVDMHVSVPAGCSLSTFGRLFLSSILPKSLDKAIYIDCDTLIMDSLDGLWETDVSGHMVALANDGHSMAYRRMLGLETEGIYFSCGIMLINLKAWREKHIERTFLEHIKSRNGYIPIEDQGVLNTVLDGQIALLPLRYNVFTAVYAFDYDEFLKLRNLKSFYNREEYKAARESPAIVHFMHNFYMPIKPWEKGCIHPYADVYLKYKRESEWKDEPLWEDGRSAVQKAYTAFCHAVPRPLMLAVSAFIHEHLIALKHRYKTWEADRMNKNVKRGGVQRDVASRAAFPLTSAPAEFAGAVA